MAAVRLICGVDEAGRGPLAGPVCAAAVVFEPGRRAPAGIADSKVLSARERERLAGIIRKKALAWSIAWASVEEIDSLNILQASLLAMRRAVETLSVLPHEVLFDGSHCPMLAVPARAIVDGDAKVRVIAAASILAKTARDTEMRRLHGQFPQYGFDAHKGYPTPQHLSALRRYGVCEVYRLSFRPVRLLLENGRRLAPDKS
ncbi:MAG TPA: ribonuclease HII [Burkholderiales bacterium]|nr:ribonuclease HII [Burkholderiales bacterium]